MNEPSQLPTPETDALCKADIYDGDDMIDHARTLERQRDEAREQVRRLREALASCLNYIENTESSFGIKLESGIKARAILAETKEAE